jgi:Transposase DDE domain group 1
VVAKAEHLEKGANPRFVVTCLSAEKMEARALYEELYWARGQMENRIKEQQLGLFADRTSTECLKGTEIEQAQCQTIRLKLLKNGAPLSPAPTEYQSRNVICPKSLRPVMATVPLSCYDCRECRRWVGRGLRGMGRSVASGGWGGDSCRVVATRLSSRKGRTG